jgi:hypothetical protein
VTGEPLALKYLRGRARQQLSDRRRNKEQDTTPTLFESDFVVVLNGWQGCSPAPRAH